MGVGHNVSNSGSILIHTGKSQRWSIYLIDIYSSISTILCNCFVNCKYCSCDSVYCKVTIVCSFIWTFTINSISNSKPICNPASTGSCDSFSGCCKGNVSCTYTCYITTPRIITWRSPDLIIYNIAIRIGQCVVSATGSTILSI